MARQSFTDEVIETLGLEIASGQLANGTLLNAEQLSERFDVSRTVVREATKILESMRMIEIRRRTGVRVLPLDEWNVLDPNIIRWRLGQEDHSAPLRSLMQLREAIEPFGARAAAAATTDVRRRLREAVEAMAAAIESRDRQRFLEHDLLFHETLIAAAGNELFNSIGRSIGGSIESQTLYNILPVEEDAHTIELHAAIVSAVEDGDPGAADHATKALFDDMKDHVAPGRGWHPSV